MTTLILDGKATAALIEKQLAQKNQRPCGLTMVLVGQHAPSAVYVEGKQRACARVGIQSHIERLPETISEAELLQHLSRLNQDPSVHGILLQLPLPRHINAERALQTIAPHKDVDGLHPVNAGKLLLGFSDGFIPCTPLGILTLLQHYQIPTIGKEVVILGRGHLVGRPLSVLLSQKPYSATVTLLHTQSTEVRKRCQSADILIAAMGSPRFVTADFVKPGAVVVDVGINYENKQLVGDVDFDRVREKTSAITPVPGGIGPMTIAALLMNVVRALDLSTD
jgi:methylenetetrahydrofolate dehydrogenase (NADP+) / methenyltetrahydrofolate cyclohydrolase